MKDDVKKLFFFFTGLLCFDAMAVRKCQTRGGSGAIVFIFCAQERSLGEIIEEIETIRSEKVAAGKSHLQIQVYNSSKQTPANLSDLQLMSVKEIEKHRIAIFNENKTNGMKSFQCKKTGRSLEDCTSLVK